MYLYKANYNDLISDFNLYLCERYGYRNACSVMWNENGICISIHRGSLDIYIRFWEYSEGVGNYHDWSIIIARCEFRDELRENRFELLKDLVRFFKEYMPRYGYKHLCPRMTTTSMTKRSTSPASNVALWATIATMEHR